MNLSVVSMVAAAPPLSAFCIGCTKYAVGDAIGKLLAVFCTAPYFAVYHCAVVAHARRCAVEVTVPVA